MTRFIRTVTGDIDPDTLGYCQCHEHLLIARGKSAEIDPSLCLDDEVKSGRELADYRASGGNALVDAQPVGCGRMADGLARLSEESGIRIIAATGFHKLLFYPDDAFLFHWPEERLADLFAGEVTDGMFLDNADGRGEFRVRSAVRAGIIKGASDGRDIRGEDSDLALYRKLFRAVGMAAVRTGAPVLTHLEMGRGFESQVEALLATGVRRRRIILCHLDRQIDLDDFGYYYSAGFSGCWLQLDTIGRFKYHDDDLEARFIAKLCENGFDDQILLGTDSTAKRLAAYGGTTPLSYIRETFREKLAQYGISDALFDKFTRINPRRALAFDEAIISGVEK